MQKPARPKSLSRQLSERARALENTSLPPGDHADPGSAAGEILGRLKNLFEQVAHAAATVQQGASPREDGAAETGQARGTVPFTIGGKEGRIVFGYTMRMGLDGVQAEPFGDIPEPAPKAGGRSAATAMKPAARAPIVDVFEEGATLRIVAELPGVAFENITCTLNEGTLQIETSLPRYSKTLRLPCPVDPASLSQTCRNGILEISLTRAAP